MGILSSLIEKIFSSNKKNQDSLQNNKEEQHIPQTIETTPVTKNLIDITSHLNQLAKSRSEKLNWSDSIVDLMKLVGMDSDLSNRKELAKELNYTGDMNDSAKMNVWLHKQIMIKIQENGGKVPSDLLN